MAKKFMVLVLTYPNTGNIIGGMKNLSTQKFGRLTVIKLDHIKKYPKQTKGYWLCRCECGNSKVIRAEHLASGRVVSCGCYSREKSRANFLTHGLSKTPEYKSWSYMRSRLNSNEPHKIKYYKNTGQVERWDKFENFFEDMGAKPTPQHELDRLDPFLPYCKENCRWATRSEQMQNTKRHYK